MQGAIQGSSELRHRRCLTLLRASLGLNALLSLSASPAAFPASLPGLGVTRSACRYRDRHDFQTKLQEWRHMHHCSWQEFPPICLNELGMALGTSLCKGLPGSSCMYCA